MAKKIKKIKVVYSDYSTHHMTSVMASLILENPLSKLVPHVYRNVHNFLDLLQETYWLFLA